MMKTVYIPKGKTVHYESLTTENLVIKGCLNVDYGVKAKTISGSGVLHAGTVGADTICIDDVEAASVVCKRLIAKRAQTPELFASESAAVSCFLSAAYVETGKLTVAISEVDEVVAQEVVHLASRKRTLWGTLFCSMLRSFWTGLTMGGGKGEVMDADYTPVQETQADAEKAGAEVSEETPAAQADEESTKESLGAAQIAPVQADSGVQSGNALREPVDEELNRFIAMFKLMRESGYTLKVVPGTPEENAPVFDFEAGKIIRPAA